MKIIAWALLQLLTLSCLTACMQEKSTTYFLTHPEEIPSAYEGCVSLNNQSSAVIPECTMVYRAIPIVKNNLTELINNPFQFGLNIMQAQNQLVSLQIKYESLKDTVDKRAQYDLLEKIAQEEVQIESRYALIRLLSKIR